MRKLVAVDLDGTLLNSSSTISTENLDAIRRAQQNNIEVVIATGRAHFDVKYLFEGTGIDTWIIAANGATLHTPDYKEHTKIPLDKQEALSALDWLEKNRFYYEVFSNNAIYTAQNSRDILTIEMDRIASANPGIQKETLLQSARKQYSQFGFSFIDSHRELADESIDLFNILAFSFEPQKLELGWKEFEDRKELTLVSSSKHNFELEHHTASKGKMLKRLAEELGVTMEQTTAIGDSLNDVSMLTAAGRGFAMANALEEVKHISTEITRSNDEHGVAHVLHQLID